MTFGSILREARERKGYDLAQAARRLRIRPDILRAIEEGDFARMPPRGYARNMVNAYARLVGLNPTEVTRRYLDEAYAYQVGRARTDQPSRREGGAGERRSGRSRAPQPEEERPPRQNAFGRTLYDDRRDYARGDGSRATGAGERRFEGRTHPSRHAALPGTQYTNFYAGPKAPNAVHSKLPFVIAGGAILVLLVVVLAFVFGGQKPADDGPKVHVSGLSDPTAEQPQDASQGEQGQQEPDATQSAPEEQAPTSAKVEVSVASGQEAWLDVYEGESITFGDSARLRGDRHALAGGHVESRRGERHRQRRGGGACGRRVHGGLHLRGGLRGRPRGVEGRPPRCGGEGLGRLRGRLGRPLRSPAGGPAAVDGL